MVLDDLGRYFGANALYGVGDNYQCSSSKYQQHSESSVFYNDLHTGLLMRYSNPVNVATFLGDSRASRTVYNEWIQ